MENHPIPQDVTGFQFKLVGNMTIKQFGYVAIGVILAVILYYLPISGLIKYPLVLLFSLTGVAFAFVPLAGRPMDVMLAHFFKDLLRPNQYVYHKVGGKLLFTDIPLERIKPQTTTSTQPQAPQHSQSFEKQAKLHAYLSQVSAQPKTEIDVKEQQFLNALFQQTTQTPQPNIQQPIAQVGQPPLPPEQPVVSTVQQIPDLPIQEPVQQTLQPPVPVEQPMPTTQPAQTISQAAPIETLPQQLTAVTAPEQIAVPQSVRAIPASQAAQLGMPALPDFPNLISGIVKDPRGNVLSNILVEVKNTEGDAVRAFKTNPLGQFVSATQLANGSYTIELEDPKNEHRFEKIQIETNGTVLPLLEVTSVDAREDLRRALFS